MTANLNAIIGIEALTGALGVELRKPLTTSAELAKVIAALRAKVATLEEEDRYMADDLKAAAELVADGTLSGVISAGILPDLESMTCAPLKPAREIRLSFLACRMRGRMCRTISGRGSTTTAKSLPIPTGIFTSSMTA